MRKFKFSRMLFLLPLAALTLAGCDDPKADDPYVIAGIQGFALQKWHDNTTYKFHADIQGVNIYSTSEIGVYDFEKSIPPSTTTSTVSSYSPKRNHYETFIGSGSSNITDIKGRYSLILINDQGVKTNADVTLAFTDADKFATGWSDQEFTYDGSHVSATFKPVEGADYYALYFAPYKENPHVQHQMNVIRSEMTIDAKRFALASDTPTTDINITTIQTYPNANLTNDIKVALIAVKDTNNGIVMLQTEWKTITAGLDVFVEDEL